MMPTDSLETPNPFATASILSEGLNPAQYRTFKDQHKRGDREYVMSRSDLMQFDWCPSRWLAGYEDAGDKSTEWGGLIDAMVLDGAEFSHRYAVTPEFYPSDEGDKPWNWNSKYCKQWRGEHFGKTIVKFDEWTEAKRAIEVLRQCEVANQILDTARTQVFVVGNYCDEDTGIAVEVKGLIDAVPMLADFEKCLVDLKTCASAGQRPWTRAVFEYGYHVQAALYMDLYSTATGEDRRTFLHILQENYPPYQVGLRMLSEEFVAAGRRKYVGALKQYCRCLNTNIWPGYEGKTRIQFAGFDLVEPEPYMLM